MIEVTAAQLDAWLAALMFPLGRLLGLFASAPVFSNRGVSVRIRLAIGLGVALAVLPVLPPMPQVPPGGGLGLAIFAQQMFIGIAIGFMMRIVFAAVDMAGALIGMQMGLSFAIFFDPDAGGQTAVLSDFLNLLATLLFLAVNGHLLMIDVVVRSTPSTQPMRSVSSSMTDTVGVTPKATRSNGPLTECRVRTSGMA